MLNEDSSYLFSDFINLINLDVSHFDTSKETDMSGMFRDFNRLKTIDVSDQFITRNEAISYDKFKNCYYLVDGNGTAYDANHVDKDFARIYKPGQPGYFTQK